MSKDYTDPPRKPNWNDTAEAVIDVADKVVSALSVAGAAAYAEELGDGTLPPGVNPNEFVEKQDRRRKILKRS